MKNKKGNFTIKYVCYRIKLTSKARSKDDPVGKGKAHVSLKIIYVILYYQLFNL